MVVADYHFLLFISNKAFVPNIGACEGVIARDHHNADLSLFELLNGSLRLRFEFVLEDLKPRKKEVGLRLLTRNLLNVCLRLFARNRQHSEPVRSVLFEFGFVVRGNAAFLHDLLHDFGRPFGVDEILHFVSNRNLADDAHPLHVGVEVKPPMHLSCLLSLGLEGENDFGVGVGLIEEELSELKQFHLHRIPDEFAGLLEADDGMVRGHIVEDVLHIFLPLEEVLNDDLLVGVIPDCGEELPFVSRDK